MTELIDERPFQDAEYAARRVAEVLATKVAKRYAEAHDLHVLLYLNMKVASVPWATLASAAENSAAAFASVWAVTGNLIACFHSGNTWPGLVGWRVISERPGG